MEKEKQKKSGGLVALVILLLIVTIASAILATYAWSKYQSAGKGNTVAEVAKWNINFTGSQTTYNYDYVVGEDIAPGTSGHFDVTIDGESEVAFEYVVRLSNIKNKPKNLKFYILKANSGGVDIVSNRVYFAETINGVRTDTNGKAITAENIAGGTAPYVGLSGTGSNVTASLTNHNLEDEEISNGADSVTSYKSRYASDSGAAGAPKKLQVFWVWPYNGPRENNIEESAANVLGAQTDGQNVSNTGVVSNDIANNDSTDDYGADHKVSTYDQEDVLDGNRIGGATGDNKKFGFTVSIVATQIRPNNSVVNNTTKDFTPQLN